MKVTDMTPSPRRHTADSVKEGDVYRIVGGKNAGQIWRANLLSCNRLDEPNAYTHGLVPSYVRDGDPIEILDVELIIHGVKS